ncbi:M48 family metallopeptidase [Methanococcoides sp. LMO-2]|uniref:YgjP-like metallopeptidase domain-containing protein n=1 Tax=Methanococcoides cohabitans TaxID=3136559 RepID=A0ABU9KXG7_9EURY
MSLEYSIGINGIDIPYSLTHRKVKRARLEFRSGRLNVVVPKGFPDHEELILRHKLWVYRRYASSLATIENAASKELVQRSDSEFRELIFSFTGKISEDLGVQPEKVTFRKMKTKWGSCSSAGRLNFNRHLMHLPDDLVEYVVFHEMAHLIELRHSPCFWQIIDSRFDNRVHYDRELSAYWYLIQDHIHK